ncbi:ABC transporter permease [Demequina silvatica]|uniref:ABC transporter permease n=1 Tax=Demequina silvatica TaxID=1638988 RepID=UPI000780F67A|nr:ABC transporter permease [Demequina silvatica]
MTEIDYAALAREAGLPRVGARQALPTYLKEMWQRRHFAVRLAQYRIEGSLNQNRLGLFWVVLSPLLQAAVYGLIFGVILPKDTREGINFIPFLVTGFFIFTFFSKSFAQGARSITGNTSLVRSLSFPRMLLPVAAVLRNLYELVPMMAVLVFILIGFGEFPMWTWLLVPVILAFMTMFNLGVALIAARLTVHVRDVTEVIPVITRLIFYTTGIFYSLEQVLADQPHWMLTAARLNPIHDFVELVRWAFMGSETDMTQLAVIAAIASVVTLIAGVFFFWTAEERYGRD